MTAGTQHLESGKAVRPKCHGYNKNARSMLIEFGMGCHTQIWVWQRMLYPNNLGLAEAPDLSYLGLQGDVIPKKLGFGLARYQELRCGTIKPQELRSGRQNQVTWVWKGMIYPRNMSFIIIIIKFEKKYYYYWRKNHRFDLKYKIKNYKNLGQTCLIFLLLL